MKTSSLSTISRGFGLATALFLTVNLHAADAAPATAAADKTAQKTIEGATAYYQTRQLKPETAILDAVVAQSKGVLVLDQWSGGVILGGTAGDGIGMKKDASGKFTAPAFYKLGGGSIGLQLGGGNTRTIAFLMSDRALKVLTDNMVLVGSDARAVAGPNSSSANSFDNKADFIFYTQASGLDVGAAVGGSQITVDNENNRKYYENPTITPSDIFSGKAKFPAAAQTLVDALNKQAVAGKSAAPINPPAVGNTTAKPATGNTTAK